MVSLPPGLQFRSSLDDDVWHADPEPGAYEWWYFDAISDDGREALVVIFLTNFVFSPRYNRAFADTSRGADATAVRAQLFPAVSVGYYRDGRPLWRVNSEHDGSEFIAHPARPACRIGRSTFELVEAFGVRRYELTLDETLRGGRTLKARLTWEVIDGNFAPDEADDAPSHAGAPHAHEWNLVAPRCRVRGDISITDRAGPRTAEQNFSGMGYHDHNRDHRPLPARVAAWQWGRAHFDDGTTAVFYRYQERDHATHDTRLFIVRDGALSITVAEYDARAQRQHIFGLRYPRELNFSMNAPPSSPLTLRIRQAKVVDASYFYLRFVGDAALDLGEGRVLHAPALSEQLAPRALRWRWLDWLTDMRIGRQGRGSFLP